MKKEKIKMTWMNEERNFRNKKKIQQKIKLKEKIKENIMQKCL